MVELNHQNEWTRFKASPPTEVGIYEWRIPSKAVPEMFIIVAAEMRWRGAGYKDVISPEFDYWDGYQVHVQCDVEWRKTTFLPEKNQRTPLVLSVEGLEISPCSHCGKVPSLRAHQVSGYGVTVNANPWNLNSWQFVCCDWGSTPSMGDPRIIEKIRRETRCRRDVVLGEPHD